MYAVVETGGRQYKVAEGQVIEVDRLPVEAGQTVELEQVLMVSKDNQVEVGTPTIPGAKVVAKVVGEEKGDKIIVFKYKAKARYRRKTGHRQIHTRLAIEKIVPGQA